MPKIGVIHLSTTACSRTRTPSIPLLLISRRESGAPMTLCLSLAPVSQAVHVVRSGTSERSLGTGEINTNQEVPGGEIAYRGC